MLRSLYGRIAAVLMVVFFLVAAVTLLATETMFEVDHLVDLATHLVIAAVAFSLGAAFVVFKLLTQRLHTLADAIDQFRATGFSHELRAPPGDSSGDEIDRLALSFRELSERIVTQFRQLAEVDERRRELLENVSHDLRTPLTSMQGYLEMLLIHDGRLSPEERLSYLQVATRQCERLGRLVQSLFELTKLEAMDKVADGEVFPLPELVQDVVQKFALGAEKRGVRLDAGFDPDCPPVLGDIGLFERLLENLIENGLRHTAAGGEVHVHVEPAGTGVALRIADTGEGIPADKLAGIFDRYYQVDRGEMGNTGSSGLGLAIVRRIVALHGGNIAVESETGRGTCFILHFPSVENATSFPVIKK